MTTHARSDLVRQISLLEAALRGVGAAVCVCDREWRLEFANQRFADAWTIESDSLRPGMPLGKLLASSFRSGHGDPEVADEYLAWCRGLDAQAGEQARDVTLYDGRTYTARHRPLPEAAWLVTLDEHTTEAINEGHARERLSLQSLIDTVPDYLWVKDVDSRFVIANKALAADWGRQPADIVGLSDCDFHPPERAASFARTERAIIETDQPIFDQHEFVLDSRGAGKWFSSTKTPLKDPSGTTVGIVGISRDITERMREIAFREGQVTVLEMIAKAAPLDDILGAIAALIETKISDAFASVLLRGRGIRRIGGSGDEATRRFLDRTLDGLPADTAAPFENGLAISEVGGDPTWKRQGPTAGFDARHQVWSMGIVSGDQVVGLLAVHPSTSRSPRPHEAGVIEIASRLAGIAVERQMTEERIRQMANHDALTGLANRSMLDELLAQAVDIADQRGSGFQVLFIDLDDFKSINDSLGHHVGDELLKEVAARLARSVGACDSVIRLGGDEFVAILTDPPTGGALGLEAVQRIAASISPPFLFGDRRMDVSCSIGVAGFPNDGRTPETLLAKADLAMYASKENGKGRFTVYEDRIRVRQEPPGGRRRRGARAARLSERG